jgi:hypothetical protein
VTSRVGRVSFSRSYARPSNRLTNCADTDDDATDVASPSPATPLGSTSAPAP